MYAELLEYWAAKRDGRNPVKPQQIEDARAIARMFGVPYMPAKELVEAGPEVMAQRLLMLKAPEHMDNGPFFRTLLGDIDVPQEGAGVLLSKMIDEIETIQATKLVNKSPNQKRKWRNAKELALKYFRASVLKDKTIEPVRHPPL